MNHLQDKHLPLNVGVDKGDANSLSTGRAQGDDKPSDVVGYLGGVLAAIGYMAASGSWTEKSILQRIDFITGTLEKAHNVATSAYARLSKPTPIELKFAEALEKQFRFVGWRDWSSLDDVKAELQAWRDGPLALVAHQVAIPRKSGGRYVVDFLMAAQSFSEAPDILVAIECDGHDFHERTKEQAARDKERDRELAFAGIITLRFTGSEIWNNAESCAQQAVDFVTESHYATVDSWMRRPKDGAAT